MLGVECGLIVAAFVLVLDIVVNERRFVKALDGERDLLQILGQRFIRV